MSDPILALARARIIKASADLEVQLSERNGGGPAIEILRRLRDRAAESLAALAFVNLCDPAELGKALTLQNEVKRYDEWVSDIRAIIAEGLGYDREMGQTEREDLLDVLMASGPRGEQEAIALGLVEPPPAD